MHDISQFNGVLIITLNNQYATHCTGLVQWNHHMDQFLQGGKKVQIMSQFFLNFTVTIQFDFFKIPQLFWRPFVNLHIFPVIAFLWNYKHPGAPVVITITIIFYLFFNNISVIFTISYKSSLGKYFYHSHDRILANGGHVIITIVINFKLSANF